MSPLAEFRALDRRHWYLAGARTVVSAGFSMVLPFLAMYLTVERKQPAIVVGVIWTLAGVCGAAMQWVAGTLSDRIGRRPVMVGSMVLRSVNLAALGWATARHGSIVYIGVLIVINAILRAFFDPVANALIADLCPNEHRVSAFSLQRVGINVGWTLGPLSAGIATYSQLFYAAAVLTLISAFVVARVREPARETSARPPDWREMVTLLADRNLARFLVATVCFYVLQVQLYQALSIYAARSLHLDRGQVATLYSLNGVIVVFLQMPIVAFIRWLGTRRALALGCLGYAVSNALVGLTTGHLTLLACVAAISIAEIITMPAQQATVTSMAPPGRVGSYAGLFGLCQVAGQSIGPLIGTALLDTVPARVAWFALASFGVAAAFIHRGRNEH